MLKVISWASFRRSRITQAGHYESNREFEPRFRQHDVQVAASIGLSTYPEDGQDAETLLKNADTAMYEAKKKGRNTYQFLKKDMNARIAVRQSIEADPRGAI